MHRSVFPVRHHNARNSTMEIALMLKEVQVTPCFLFCAMSLLRLTRIVQKHTASLKIDIDSEEGGQAEADGEVVEGAEVAGGADALVGVFGVGEGEVDDRPRVMIIAIKRHA